MNPSENFIKNRLTKKNNLSPVEKFITDNFRLVCIYARNYANSRVDADDLISIGIKTLIEIYPKFNSSLSKNQSAYVQSWLRCKMGIYAKKYSTVFTLPIHPNTTEEYKIACDPMMTMSIDSLDEDDCCIFMAAKNSSSSIIDYAERKVINKVIRVVLTPRERKLVELHYNRNIPIASIDKMFSGGTPARKILYRARCKLKKYFNKKNIRLEL